MWFSPKSRLLLSLSVSRSSHYSSLITLTVHYSFPSRRSPQSFSKNIARRRRPHLITSPVANGPWWSPSPSSSCWSAKSRTKKFLFEQRIPQMEFFVSKIYPHREFLFQNLLHQPRTLLIPWKPSQRFSVREHHHYIVIGFSILQKFKQTNI